MPSIAMDRDHRLIIGDYIFNDRRTQERLEKPKRIKRICWKLKEDMVACEF